MTDKPVRGGVQEPHVSDDLADYVLRQLSPTDARRIGQHVAHCAPCAAELRAWEAIAAVERDAASAAPAPAPHALQAVLAAISSAEEPVTASVPESAHPGERSSVLAVAEVAKGDAAADRWLAALRHAAAVAWAQTRIMQRVVWPASAAGIVLALILAAILREASAAADVLTFALPLITSAGTAFLYGSEVDASLELTLGTPTSARVVLTGRFALLFGFDLALALMGSCVLAAARGQSVTVLVPSWLGPMALLATLSLALSLALGPLMAVAGAWALWLSRSVQLVTGREGDALQLSAAHLWHTTPVVVVAAAGLLALAIGLAPRTAPSGAPQ